MHLIVGLGNIGEEYKYTRHNVGFMVVDAFAKEWRIPLRTVKFSALFGIGELSKGEKTEKVIIAKPLTFMNLSGRAVKPLKDAFVIPSENIIVIHDDIDLPIGSIRIKTDGNDAGHKGIRSIYSLVEKNIIRVRMGIGRPYEKSQVVNYVLSTFGKDEVSLLKETIKNAVKSIETIIFSGLEEAQRNFNR